MKWITEMFEPILTKKDRRDKPDTVFSFIKVMFFLFVVAPALLITVLVIPMILFKLLFG